MIRVNKFLFLADNLSADRAVKLRNALLVAPHISDVSVKVNSGLIAVMAKHDPSAEVQLACSIAGCTYRMKVDKKKAAYWA